MTLLFVLFLLPRLGQTDSFPSLVERVVDAVNCGGPEHIGEGGIRYRADQPIAGTIDSDFGQKFYFVNAHPNDRALYQTERYSLDSFKYSFPAKDGHFVLILKFSEVYFTRPGLKIFNVNLNGIPILRNLDIFEEANYVGAALDKYIEFKIEKGVLQAAGQKVSIGSSIDVEFAKGPVDNPKVNAIAILTGGEAGLLPLPPHFDMEEVENNYREERFIPEDEETEEEEDKWQKMEDVRMMPEPDAVENVASGPRAPNPYEQQGGYMGIILVGLLVLTIPVVFLLQRVQ